MQQLIATGKGIIIGLICIAGIHMLQAQAVSSLPEGMQQIGASLFTSSGISTNVFHARQNALFEQNISVFGAVAANKSVTGQTIRAVEDIHAGESVKGHDGYFVSTVGIGTNATKEKIASGLRLDVDGKIGSTYYCDREGENCIKIKEIQNILPSGAVIPFATSSCPSGWSFYGTEGNLTQCKKN